LRKLQTSAGAQNLSRSFARRADNDRTAGVARALTARTLLARLTVILVVKTRERFFKTKRERYFNIRAFFRQRSRRFGFALLRFGTAAEQIRENIPKARTAARAARLEIEAGKIKTRVRIARPAPTPVRRIRVEIIVVITETVENLAFFLVGKNVVGFLDFFEFVLGCFIVRIYIRVKLARQLAIRLFNLVRFGVFCDAENTVIIFVAID
jgi:hypothetical protein